MRSRRFAAKAAKDRKDTRTTKVTTERRTMINSAHAAGYLDKAVNWLGVSQAFHQAYIISPSVGLMPPTFTIRRISIRLLGPWVRRVRKACKLWRIALQGLPHLLRRFGRG